MLPQEIEVWYIIPALRKEYAKLLTKDYGFSYEKTGLILGTTKAAISQYIADKRANKIKLNLKVKKLIRDSARKVAKNPQSWLSEVQSIMKFMRENRCSCDVCKQYNKDILSYCNSDPNHGCNL